MAVARTYPVGDRTVGYVVFENFVEPSRAALDDAFRRLRQEGANELVLDVRYNGGRLVRVATHLAGNVWKILTKPGDKIELFEGA